MAEDIYLRLYRELNASRFYSDEANEAIEQLGAPARVIRALARARRHAWSSARVDLRAAAEAPNIAPVVEFVTGVGLYVVRDYDLALTVLARAASRGKPGIAKQARMFALRFATALGWASEARELERLLGRAPADARIELDQAETESPERTAQRAWELAFVRGPRFAEAILDQLLARPPNHPAIVAARVRLDLLCDRPDAAAARLAAAPAELREQLLGERAALALLRGDPQQAVVRTVHARNDPRLLYLRGQALLTLNEIAEASELLERARAELPQSVSIGLALAIARHRQDPNTFGEGLERRFEDLLEWAPGLLSDAANALGVEIWTDQGPLNERADKVAILTLADAMLTREADVARPSYRCTSSAGQPRLRHVPIADELRGPTLLQNLHADDRELIDHVNTVLVKAIGIKPPRPEVADKRDVPIASAGPWRPQFLSPEQIEQFLVDGFLVVRQAFDPSISEAWREDANRRIREEPEKWVRGYDPSDEARSLRHYSPDDPSTWAWGRVDLEGPETVSIEEFSPSAWATICDLLGGPDRIKTRTWQNYLIINFCADAHLGFDSPEPDWESWHIDDPSPMTRIDRLQNGLVGIALHDRLLPRSGNTWIVPDSVGHVARELAAHPEGVDFVHKRGNRITTQCERFHEFVGEAGDILLMHPLMMHSSSPNRSGRIRWMGNPMVYLNEPLDPYRPVDELSPVELAIHRAINQ